MYERRQEALLSQRAFLKRFLKNAILAAAFVVGALLIGVCGYHYTEHISWLDALLNASMILSGMGPAQELKTDSGKWFASFYALFSGVAFITTVGVLFAPVIHRSLHRFHLEFDEEDSSSRKKRNSSTI